MTTQAADLNATEKNLNQLISFFPQWGNWLPWSQVLFVEVQTFAAGKVPEIPQSALISSQDYAKRFDELLESGYHWINMNALGIWKDNLIIVIELPSYKSNIPKEKVSVNFSGPVIIDEKPQWDLSNRIEVLE